MITELSRKVAYSLKESGITNIKDVDIYAYGMEILISYSITVCISVFFGICMGITVEVLLFMLAYIPLRIYVGGYHADSYGKCLILSCMTVLISAMLAKYALSDIGQLVVLLVMIPIGASISMLGVVEHKNRPLELAETIEYNHKIKVVLIVEYIAAVLLGITGLHIIVRILCVSWVVMLGMSLLGKIENKV